MADQNALNVTANNVANQNTPGYTREVVSWQPSDAVTLSGASYSTGITTTAVSQRDRDPGAAGAATDADPGAERGARIGVAAGRRISSV